MDKLERLTKTDLNDLLISYACVTNPDGGTTGVFRCVPGTGLSTMVGGNGMLSIPFQVSYGVKYKMWLDWRRHGRH